MTSHQRRTLAAAAELNRLRRGPGLVELPDAHDPTRAHTVDRFVVDVRDHFGFGAPVGEEYAVTGWRTGFADRAQDFEGGTIYLDTTTGQAGFFSWRAYAPLRADTPQRSGDQGRSENEP